MTAVGDWGRKNETHENNCLPYRHHLSLLPSHHLSRSRLAGVEIRLETGQKTRPEQPSGIRLEYMSNS